MTSSQHDVVDDEVRPVRQVHALAPIDGGLEVDRRSREVPDGDVSRGF